MIRYQYTAQGEIHIPLVHGRLRHPTSGQEIVDVVARIDSGADRTVIPVSLVAQLNLPQTDAVAFEGLDGSIVQLPTYLVQVSIRDLRLVPVSVAAAREPYVLLGVDVLGQYRIVLDGPGRFVDIA